MMQEWPALLPSRGGLPGAGTMFPPTTADWKSPKFWVNWTTWWVSNINYAFPISTSINSYLLSMLHSTVRVRSRQPLLTCKDASIATGLHPQCNCHLSIHVLTPACLPI